MSRPGRRRSQTIAGWLFLALALAVTHQAVGPRELGGPAGYVVVRGDSMEPTYTDGDLVITRSKARYEVGDVITYQPEIEYDFPVIHRVVAVDGDDLVTRGDNRDEDDAWGVATEAVVGSTWLRIPRGGIVLAHLFQPATLFALVIFVVVLVVLRRKEPRAPSPPAATVAEREARRWIDAVTTDDDPRWSGRRPPGPALQVLVVAGTVVVGINAVSGGRDARAAALEVRAPVVQVFELALDDLPPP